MISRIWNGWTRPEQADAYENLLKEEIFVGIEGRNIQGFRSIQLLSRELAAEVEFVTILEFDALHAVRVFAGRITNLYNSYCLQRECCVSGLNKRSDDHAWQ